MLKRVLSQTSRPGHRLTNCTRNLASGFCSTSSSSASGQSQDAHYDIAIVGGGAVGATLALLLGKSAFTKHLSVCLVDPKPPKGLDEFIAGTSRLPAAKFDPRVFAIAPSSIAVFEEVGAWPRMLNTRTAPYTGMQVWQKNGGGFKLDSTISNRDSLGHIIENDVIVKALYSELRQCSNVDLIVDSVAKMQRVRGVGGQSVRSHVIQLSETGNSLSTGLLVGCDGAMSRVREHAFISTVGWTYQQHALVASVQTSATSHTAYQRFLDNGPLALLPLPGDFSSIVWSNAPLEVDRLKNLSEEDFLKEFNHALGVTARDVGLEMPPEALRLAGPRLSFPLKWQQVQSLVGPCTALAGDAAHSVHPLAGQGMNLGIGDAVALAVQVAEGIQSGAQPGEHTVLERYDKSRRPVNLAWGGIIDGVSKLFTADLPMLPFLRGAGMTILNNTGFIKNEVIKLASAQSTDVKKLQCQMNK